MHQPGHVIGDRYQIASVLGQGGTGITYKAEDLISGGNVAIKVLSLNHLTDWKALELFEREVNVLKSLRHAAIPEYLNHFQVDLPDDRLFYLVQQLAEGESLAALVSQGWRTNEVEVRAIAAQILEIFNYLHWLTPPVIHRDIKPQNIIRRVDGRVFLVDFGTVQSAYRNTLTANTFVGTFGYMPPEQFRGQAFFASDLYGLGATLLFLLTHRSPADLPQQRMRILFRDRIQVSKQFADWLEKMLEPTVKDRFHSAEEALAVLQQKRQISRPLPQLQQQATPLSLPPSPITIEELKELERSRIRVDRTPDRLIIEIPPAGLLSMLGVRVIQGFFIFLILMLTIEMIIVGDLAVIFFIVLSCPIGYLLLISLLFGVAGYRQLEINPQSFCISWKCLNFGDRQFGSTAALTGASVEAIPYHYQNHSPHRSRLVLHEGANQYLFGPATRRAEQEWLAAEISDFLTQLRQSFFLKEG
nr:serine/threonine-protein kinase [Leptolyngbya sp. FACHB-671]